MRNYVIDGSNMPSLLAPGHWKMEMTFYQSGLKVEIWVIYFKIVSPFLDGIFWELTHEEPQVYIESVLAMYLKITESLQT